MRNVIRNLIDGSLFGNTILLFVFFNTVVLALDGSIANTDTLFDQFNLTFTIVFTIEMGFKLIGLGPKGKLCDL